MSLPGPRPKATTARVNPSLSDHGNGLQRGARGSGGSGGSLVADWDGGPAAAAVAVALAQALSAMQPGGSERELAVGWEAEAEAVAAADPQAAAEQVRVDTGASGEPERKAREERAKDPVPAQPRATEEGDARVLPRPPPAPPVSRPKPAPIPGLWTQSKPRSKGQSCKRSSSHRSGEYHCLRPVTVDSSKARTSLDALKISIRQLQWKEVRPGPAAWARGGGQDDLAGAGGPWPVARAEYQPQSAHP